MEQWEIVYIIVAVDDCTDNDCPKLEKCVDGRCKGKRKNKFFKPILSSQKHILLWKSGPISPKPISPNGDILEKTLLKMIFCPSRGNGADLT